MVNTTKLLDNAKQVVKQEVISQATHIAIGTGSTTPTPTDTSLENEVYRKERQEYSEENDSVIISGWIGTNEANGNTIREIGLFNADSNGDLLMRAIIDEIQKTDAIELWIDIEERINTSQ